MFVARSFLLSGAQLSSTVLTRFKPSKLASKELQKIEATATSNDIQSLTNARLATSTFIHGLFTRTFDLMLLKAKRRNSL